MPVNLSEVRQAKINMEEIPNILSDLSSMREMLSRYINYLPTWQLYNEVVDAEIRLTKVLEDSRRVYEQARNS